MTGACDFCSAPNPKWMYHTEAFTMRFEKERAGSVTIHDVPGWAACDVCADFVDMDSRSALACRSLSKFEDTHGVIMAENRTEIFNAMRSMHDAFFRAKLSGRELIKAGDAN